MMHLCPIDDGTSGLCPINADQCLLTGALILLTLLVFIKLAFIYQHLLEVINSCLQWKWRKLGKLPMYESMWKG